LSNFVIKSPYYTVYLYFRYVCIRDNFFCQPDAQIFFILIHLVYSSTWFEHYCAHLQEDNCISTVSGIANAFTWLFSTQVTGGLVRISPFVACAPKESDDTRYCTNTIWTPEDEHNTGWFKKMDSISYSFTVQLSPSF
jgi:hypothetical protein